MTDAEAPARLTAGSVKTLAHPLRSRLLLSLRLRGPATATELARELGTNSGATSYHLRQLENAGLVVDTGTGDGKRRVWAPNAAAAAGEASDIAGDDDAAAALGWLERDWLSHFTEKFGRWLDVRRTWPRRWQDAAGMNDSMIVVTADQLGELHGEIEAVLARYRRVGQGNPSARRIAAYVSFYPVDMDQGPRP